MLDRIKKLFETPQQETQAEQLDIKLAVAALLVEAACADEEYDEREKSLIDSALAAQFGLSAQDAQSLRAEAEAAQSEALDLHRFTKVAKTMPESERASLIETLWMIVLSDGERDPHEDALIRRICGLIYVSDPESGRARQRAAAKLERSGDGA